MDVVRGNPTLFMRRDEVEAAWTWVEPILERWRVSPKGPSATPPARPAPPPQRRLLERDGRTWQEPDQ